MGDAPLRLEPREVAAFDVLLDRLDSAAAAIEARPRHRDPQPAAAVSRVDALLDRLDRLAGRMETRVAGRPIPTSSPNPPSVASAVASSVASSSVLAATPINDEDTVVASVVAAVANGTIGTEVNLSYRPLNQDECAALFAALATNTTVSHLLLVRARVAVCDCV